MSKKPNEKGKKDRILADSLADSTKTGIFIFKDKSRYDGEYKEVDGIIYRHGTGKCQTSETLYVGQWDMDKMTGKGKLEFSSGAYFEGTWKDNQFQGMGIYTWNDDSSLTGEWNENCVLGPAKFVDEDGHGWVGVFKKGSKSCMAPILV
jgi:hypothetical protein